MTTKVGRNDPCPCGSGLKYKRCCGGIQPAPQPGGNGGNLPPHVQETIDALGAGQYENIEHLQAATDIAMQRANARGIDDFAGLSPEHMYRMLYFPFDSLDVVAWVDPLPVAPVGPAIDIAMHLLEALGSEGAKRTAKGNLPRNLCRDLLARWRAVYGEDRLFLPANLQSELDFRALHRVRVAMELGGLIRKYRGRFVTTRATRERLERHGAAGIYPALLRAYADRFNWAYDDGHPSAPMLQQCFLFSLHLFNRFGAEWRPASFYEDAVIRAFPMLVDDFEANEFWSAEESFRRAYTLRTLNRFAAFFGLIEMESDEPTNVLAPPRVRRLPLLGQVLEFNRGHPAP